MPVHNTFPDLFVGSGVILERKSAVARSYAVDLDAEAVEQLPDASGLVKVCDDAMRFLDEFDYAAAGQVLFYADPPYLHSTRTSRKRYRHALTDGEHVELLDRLRRIPAPVILSGYPSELYDSPLAGRCAGFK
jgi:16S rRNA G966 N2-methylase RsmD